MNERKALIGAIAANPCEDTPRLVFADWLDDARRHREACVQRIVAEPENTQRRLDWAAHLESVGQQTYAVYVRSSLIDIPPDRPPASFHEPAFRSGPSCVECDGSGYRFGGNRIKGDAPNCLHCDCGDAGGLTSVTTAVHWRRGCPERVDCRLEDVVERIGLSIPRDGWQYYVTDWARRVCRWHPVLELRAVNVIPTAWRYTDFAWHFGRFDRSSALPEFVFDALRDYDDVEDGLKIYRTIDGAHLALARALAHLARA